MNREVSLQEAVCCGSGQGGSQGARAVTVVRRDDTVKNGSERKIILHHRLTAWSRFIRKYIQGSTILTCWNKQHYWCFLGALTQTSFGRYYWLVLARQYLGISTDTAYLIISNKKWQHTDLRNIHLWSFFCFRAITFLHSSKIIKSYIFIISHAIHLTRQTRTLAGWKMI